MTTPAPISCKLLFDNKGPVGAAFGGVETGDRLFFFIWASGFSSSNRYNVRTLRVGEKSVGILNLCRFYLGSFRFEAIEFLGFSRTARKSDGHDGGAHAALHISHVHLNRALDPQVWLLRAFLKRETR